MIQRLRIFLGPRHFRALMALLAGTGLASLALQLLFLEATWLPALQMALALTFVTGAAALILSRLPVDERKRWLAIIVPAALAIIIGSLAAPQWTGLFVGGGLGWMVAGVFIFRDAGMSRSYRRAVKAMRKGEHAAAIAEMNAQINEEPTQAGHYRFRAELHRLHGDLKAARRDYRRMAELDGGSAVAYNGLAEVELQAGRLKQARQAARTAHQLAPEEWVAAYNLGMIEERLGEYEAAAKNLRAALGMKIPDSRHRLLAHLYLWRASSALRDDESARNALAALRNEKTGLEEWQVIMSADEARALRQVLSADIDEARRLVAGDAIAAAG